MATAESNNAPENTPDAANPRKRKVMLLGLVALIVLGGLGSLPGTNSTDAGIKAPTTPM